MSSLILTEGACESDDGLGAGEDSDDVGGRLVSWLGRLIASFD